MRRGSWLVAGLVLLGFAWLFATPPFQPPDEASHYLRALTIDRGQLVGPRVPLDPTGVAWLRQGGWRAQEQQWIDHDRRGVFVASRLSPPGQPCLNDTVDTSGCTEVSYTGDYFPLAFGLPAVAIGASGSWNPALWLGRAASLLPVLLFLALALAYPRRRSGWATLGVLAAVTPMVLFIGAALNPSGLEIAAALAFLSGLLELRAEPERFSWWQSIGLIVSGVVTILAWQLGLFYAVLYIAVWLTLLGRAGLRDLLAAQRSRMMAAAAALLAAAVVYFSYGLAFGVLHSPLHLTPIGASLRAGRNELTLALRGAIGIFGAYNVPLPSPMSQIWLLAAAALLGFAAWRATRRERIVIALIGAFAIVFPIVFYGFSYRYSGFGLQGRYVLPALILVPMVAGHVLDRHSVSVSGWLGVTLRVAIVAIAAFQLAAWWVNAHHWAASSSPVLTHAAWSPPPGWWPLLLAAVAGAIALAAAGLLTPAITVRPRDDLGRVRKS